ncbi:hypothetical protein KAT55_10755 [Candidatus Bathyarchaeota archaeon]|nr:hypothetical protein [Candidatus Bathyarchaeota archaeon]
MKRLIKQLNEAGHEYMFTGATAAGMLAYTLLRKAKSNGKMRHHGSPVHNRHP